MLWIDGERSPAPSRNQTHNLSVARHALYCCASTAALLVAKDTSKEVNKEKNDQNTSKWLDCHCDGSEKHFAENIILEKSTNNVSENALLRKIT